MGLLPDRPWFPRPGFEPDRGGELRLPSQAGGSNDHGETHVGEWRMVKKVRRCREKGQRVLKGRMRKGDRNSWSEKKQAGAGKKEKGMGYDEDEE